MNSNEGAAMPSEQTVVPSELRMITDRDLRENPSLVKELRTGGDFIEQRTAPSAVEIRAQEDGSWTLIGHAAVFDSLSENLGGFQEKIARGAFRRILKTSTLDVRCLFNHDSNLILGRTPGTLTLREDPTGLVYECTVADTSYGRDLRVLLEQGIVSQSSFAFRVDQAGQAWSEDPDGILIRTITDFTDLLDVSPVTYPAYTETSAQVSRDLDSETTVTQDSSNRSSEQDDGGAAAQPIAQADDQPRRADEEKPNVVDPRSRRLRLRERLAH